MELRGCGARDQFFTSPGRGRPFQHDEDIDVALEYIEREQKESQHQLGGTGDVSGRMSVFGTGGSLQSDTAASSSNTTTQGQTTVTSSISNAYTEIIEQPQPKALRFRYICEGRSAGSIPGINSTPEYKTYPTIKIHGYKGHAVVVVSCVTVDEPHRPHPHNLVGKEGCKHGICTMTINNESMECTFPNLGIQCIKKRDVEQALTEREQKRVDPFSTGFSHKLQPQNIDLNAVRLCFQVFIMNPSTGKCHYPLTPVVSHPIYDKKATSELLICKLSDCTSSVIGGKEIILLCEKVTKEDIEVEFVEVNSDNTIVWQQRGDFQSSDVHKQVAISFKTPKYKDINVRSPVKVFIRLHRPSDNQYSEMRAFEYLPMDSDPEYLKRKIKRQCNTSNYDRVNTYIEENIAPALLNPYGAGAIGGIGTEARLGGAAMAPISGAPSPLGQARSASTGGSRMYMKPASTKIVKEEVVEDLLSASPCDKGGLMKVPISPHHNGGGMYYPQSQPDQVSTYPTTLMQSPGGSMIGSPLPPHTPQPYLTHLSPGPPPTLEQHSPFSPQSHQGGLLDPIVEVFSSPVVTSAAGGPALDPIGSCSPQAQPHLLNMDAQKPDLEVLKLTSGELELPVASSASGSNNNNEELIEKHLSVNLSHSLSIIDPLSPRSTNQLNTLPPTASHTQMGTGESSGLDTPDPSLSFIPNIPSSFAAFTVSEALPIHLPRFEDSNASMTSAENLAKVKSDLQYFNS